MAYGPSLADSLGSYFGFGECSAIFDARRSSMLDLGGASTPGFLSKLGENFCVGRRMLILHTVLMVVPLARLLHNPFPGCPETSSARSAEPRRNVFWVADAKHDRVHEPIRRASEPPRGDAYAREGAKGSNT